MLDEEIKEDTVLKGRSLCAHGVRVRSKWAEIVEDLTFPESSSCCVSHDVLSSLIWSTVEQTGHLRSRSTRLLFQVTAIF